MVVWAAALVCGQGGMAQEAAEDDGVLRGDPVRMPVACDASTWETAGLVCSASRRCRFDVELFDVAASGSALLLVGEVYAEGGSLRSLALMSWDRGETWLPAGEPIVGGAIEHALWVDDRHGWMAGQQKLPTGQSVAFVLATQDGGEFWQRFAVRPDAEDGEDRVEGLCFSDKDRGQLVLNLGTRQADAYERYESMTGGRSWTLRSRTPELPQMSGCRKRPEDWRVRLDGASNVWVLEQRFGVTWTPKARFALEAGICP